MPLNTERAYVRLEDKDVSRSLRMAAVDANMAPSRYVEAVLREALELRGYYGETVSATPTTGKEEVSND